jgi:DNA-binding MarR family transcriptional regulator
MQNEEDLNFVDARVAKRATTAQGTEMFSKAVESRDTRILGLSRKLFHPERILIMKILVRHGQVDFRELKQLLGTTEGNLASHMRALEAEEFITVYKQFEGRRPRTSYEPTMKGMKAFKKFTDAMKGVME